MAYFQIVPMPRIGVIERNSQIDILEERDLMIADVYWALYGHSIVFSSLNAYYLLLSPSL